MATTEIKESPPGINRVQWMVRKVVVPLTAGALNKTIITPEPNNLTRLAELSEQGYGSLVISNHFSMGEPARIVSALLERKEFFDKRLLAPFGIHQLKPYLGASAAALGIKFCPLVIGDTMTYVQDHPEKRKKYEKYLSIHESKGLLDAYFDQGTQALGKGDPIILFPQGGRRPALEKLTTAVSRIIGKADEKGIDKFALLFLGIGVKGIEDYGKKSLVHSINFFKEYEINVGNLYILEDYKKKAQETGLNYNKLAKAELELVVPKFYLPKTA